MQSTQKQKSKFIQELASTRPTTSKSKNQYVDNKQFLQHIIEYQAKVKANKKAKLPKPKIPDIIGKQLWLIAENLTHKANFRDYSFTDEMIGDAIENCLMYFDNFNPKRSKYPFSYFTKIIYYAFIRRIQREKRQLYIKYKATQMSGILHESQDGEDGESGQQFELYENISEFIDRYEKSQAASKEPKIPVPKKGIELLINEED